MGQAKRRGTFEERKGQAVLRNQRNQRIKEEMVISQPLPPFKRETNQQILSAMALFVAATGFTLYPRKKRFIR